MEMRVEISVRAQATENSILGIEGVSYEPVQNKLTVISLVTNAQDYYPLEFMEHEKPHLFCTKISIDIAKMNTLPKSIERIIVSDQQSLAEAKERAVGLYYDLHDYQTQKQLALVDFGSIEETKNLAQINVKKSKPVNHLFWQDLTWGF